MVIKATSRTNASVSNVPNQASPARGFQRNSPYWQDQSVTPVDKPNKTALRIDCGEDQGSDMAPKTTR
jgi:hypothetical protein